MTTKELIRAEIERLKSKYRHNGLWTSSFQSDLAMAKIESMNDLLSFLDSLPDEPVTDCHELTEAAEKSARQYYVDGGYSPFPNMEMASHIAGFKAGAEWMKTKMMEGAVEGTVIELGETYKDLSLSVNAKELNQVLQPLGVGDGNKVKIIIVKEEEK